VIVEGKASAVLLASILHYRKFTIQQIKDFLKDKGINVRI